MDHKAVPCNATATVRNLPSDCSPGSPTNRVSRNLVDDADGDGNVLVEQIITCSEPAAEEPAAEEPAAEVMDAEPVEVMDDTGETDDTGGMDERRGTG